MPRVLLFACVALLTSLFSLSSFADNNACHLASAAAMNQTTMAQNYAKTATNTIKKTPMPSKMACLSTVLDGFSLPGFHMPSISAIIKGLMKKACQAAQKEWNKTVNELKDSASLPYGLGVDLGYGGYDIDMPDVTDVVDGATGGKAGEAVGSLGGYIDQGGDWANGELDSVTDQEVRGVDKTQETIDKAADLDIFGGHDTGKAGSNTGSDIYGD